MHSKFILVSALAFLSWNMAASAVPILHPLPQETSHTASPTMNHPSSTSAVSTAQNTQYQSRFIARRLQAVASAASLCARQFHNEDYGSGDDSDDVGTSTTTQSASSTMDVPSPTPTTASPQPTSGMMKRHRRRNTHAVPTYGTASFPADKSDSDGLLPMSLPPGDANRATGTGVRNDQINGSTQPIPAIRRRVPVGYPRQERRTHAELELKR